MRTETINDILSVCKLYRGALPSDADFHFQTPYCCVTNVDSHNGKGTHWNAWIVTDQIYFFDSFGRRPTDDTFPDSYREFVKNRKYIYNPKIVQGLFSNTCGHFCIYVLYYKCLEYDWDDIMNSFSDDSRVNDMYVRRFVSLL